MKRFDWSSGASLAGRLVECTFWVAIMAVAVVSVMAILGQNSA